MNHDALCSNQSEYFDGSILWPARCECELIAKIRADEREKVAMRIEELGCCEETRDPDATFYEKYDVMPPQVDYYEKKPKSRKRWTFRRGNQ